MQDHNWNDLKFLLAVHRAGSFAQAAQKTGVDPTTIARRLKRLETALGAALLYKAGQGQYTLTEAAAAILERVERIEDENNAIRERLGQLANTATGTVRISSVPYIINRFLVPALGTLRKTNPDLTVDLVPEARNIDLNKREADLAVRFSRPSQGGLEVKARKLGIMCFDVFCSADIPLDHDARLDWIGYETARATLPQARWIDAAAKRQGVPLSPLRVADLDTAHQAVLSGLGKSVLPKRPCLGDARLRRVVQDGVSEPMERPVWLLSHATDRNRRSLAVTKAWLQSLVWS